MLDFEILKGLAPSKDTLMAYLLNLGINLEYYSLKG